MSMKKTLVTLAIASSVSASACAFAFGQQFDFGEQVEFLAKSQSLDLFGVYRPLDDSSTLSLTAAQANANPAKLVKLANGLTAKVVSADAGLGPNIDMMALWPNDSHPTHLIACNEQGSAQVALQRINLSTGAVANIISSGLSSCDPVRRTAWGTIIFGEENGSNGRIFELLDPLTTTGVTVSGSGAGTTTSDPGHVAVRPALGQLSFEGIALYPNGVMYFGDENRPGNGNPGGAYFKFIPSTLWSGGVPISTLADSPLVAGNIYGMRVGKRSGNTDYGQGNEFGRGTWIPVTGAAPINLRAAASTLKLTSYYRPEDLDIDLAVLEDGDVRFCGNNTGEDTQGGDNHWGETICITDGTLAEAADKVTLSTPEYQPLVFGNFDMAMMDNIAYQPGTGNWLVNEDGEGPVATPARNNDIWSCLDDGDDKDILADACVKVISLNDLNAESTGGIFDATGKRYFVSIQHNVTGHGVILEINGWGGIMHKHHNHH
ncbi:MAG: alkaline phosphatase PhoX [Sulfuricaulis sp.]|uniref:alkaline phosphatase PhoX n=1 Tax=Sulfuricaulis sp. TaxID=2003553 RepID=UPI003C41FBFD